MKRTGSGSGPRQDGCTCGELVPEHLPGCPVVPFAAALSSPETTPAGVLPPVTPIPGLDVQSANDLLSPEAKAGLDANLRDIARTQRQALSAAATMPLGSALSSATPAGVLDEAWAAAEKALPENWDLWLAATGPGFMAQANGPRDESVQAWSQADPELPNYDPNATPAAALHALAVALGRSGSGT